MKVQVRFEIRERIKLVRLYREIAAISHPLFGESAIREHRHALKNLVPARNEA